jgi:hypothetical protein
VFACALVSACGDDAPAVGPVSLSGDPVALDQQLLFVDATHERAYLLDVSAARPKAESKRITLPPSAAVSQRRAGDDHDEALILCAGRRGDESADAADSALVKITNQGRSLSYDLGTTPFNRLTQSSDGRYAIVFRGNDLNTQRTLDNPNELVVVDLDKAPEEDDAVTRKTPEGLGHTLSSVLVSPSMNIAGQDRRLLVVLSAEEDTLFDLNHLDRRATIVQLDESRAINPEQVEFSESNPTLYVRGQSSDSVYMFRFESQDSHGDALRNDFRPTINPLGAGSGPRDIKLFGDGANERLMVVAEKSGQVLVIDPSSSKTVALKLKQPAQHILLFHGSSPTDGRLQDRALLYGDNATGVTFFDAEDLGDSPEDKLETVSTPVPANGILTLQDEGKVMLLQATGVSVLNLVERTLTPISAGSSLGLKDALFDEQHERLWVAPPSQTHIGSLDLETGMTGEVRLDAAIQSVVPMFGMGRLVAIHAGDLGYITLLELDQPDREHAVSVRGFFASDVLDRSGS